MDILTPIEKEKDSLISFQSNKLITQSYTDLTLSEWKLLHVLISTLKPDADDFRPIIIPASTIATVLGMDYHNGGNKRHLNRILISLLQKSLISISPDDDFDGYTWFSKISNVKNNILFLFNPYLRPFLLNLQAGFTAFRVAYILDLESIYSSRLYELCQCFCWKKKWSISVNEFRLLMGFIDPITGEEQYQVFKKLKYNVIVPSIEEINAKTDLCVTVSYIRSGRSVTDLDFNIKRVRKSISDSAQQKLSQFQKMAK